MAYTFQGVGTTYIAKRDFRSDGSYVTTEWIAFANFPIAPRRSLRVIDTGSEDNSRLLLLRRRDTYRVLETTRPNWKQVLYVYSFAILYIAWVASYLIYRTDFSSNEGVVLWFAALAFPFVIPYGLRWYAKRKKP